MTPIKSKFHEPSYFLIRLFNHHQIKDLLRLHQHHQIIFSLGYHSILYYTLQIQSHSFFVLKAISLFCVHLCKQFKLIIRFLTNIKTLVLKRKNIILNENLLCSHSYELQVKLKLKLQIFVALDIHPRKNLTI